MAHHYLEVEPMLTISEAARVLNVHVNTVRRWSKQGLIKSYRIGSRGDRRFHRKDVDNLLIMENKVNKP